MGHWALGMGHWASGIGHWALNISYSQMTNDRQRFMIQALNLFMGIKNV
jgi:hypothetical protein